MLLLSRRSKDKIVFPQIGATVHFIRVQSGHVNVGIDVPDDVDVLHDDFDAPVDIDEPTAVLPQDLRHGIRNELHQISVGIHLYKELLAASLEDEAADTFADIQASLGRLDQIKALNPDSYQKITESNWEPTASIDGSQDR